MKRCINKLKMVFAVIAAKKAVILIDKGNVVVQYTYGVNDDEVEELKDLDFNE